MSEVRSVNMADKAEKIAAARKKLKQYQARQKDRDHDTDLVEANSEPSPPDITCPATSAPITRSLSPPPSSASSSMETSTAAGEFAATLNTNNATQANTVHHDVRSNFYSSPAFDRQQPTTADDPNASISNYFTRENNTLAFSHVPSGADFFGNIEPQLAPNQAAAAAAALQPVLAARHPDAAIDANLININKISDEIGNLIANANADLGPQNTILELESEKADLARQLNVEKLENDELRLRLRNNQSLVDELKIEIDKLRLENSTRVTVELGPLQEQLQMQIQAVGVLVGEKAELTASLGKCQSLVKERMVENETLQHQLKETHSVMQKLEHELCNAKNQGQRYDHLEQAISSQVSEYQREAERFRKLHEDLQEDLAELRQKLTVRNEEYQNIQQALEQTRSDLGLAKIRIDQLTSDDGQDYNAKIESLTQQTLIKAQQIKDLQEVVKQIGTERDQSNQQYQNYVLHLNKEIGNLAEKIQELTDENNRLAKNEELAVRFANELERQIQQQMQKQQSIYAAQQEPTISKGETSTTEEQEKLKKELDTLHKRCIELEHENESWKTGEALKDKEKQTNVEAQLRQYEEQIATLQLTVDRLQLDKPDVAKLLAEIECGKVGASRAVTQNQELKSQLEEMQRAFVQISNDKLNLTDKLQTELHLCKEMKANYGNLEADLAAIREKLHYKDEEMIRLTHENTELSKQIFQQNQEIDRLRYYESRSNDASTLQRELEKQKRTVDDLQRQLRGAIEPKLGILENTSEQQEHPVEIHQLQHEIETLRQEKSELLKALNRFQHDRSKEATADGANVSEATQSDARVFDRQSSIVSSIPTIEAMEKLQLRFKRTMLEVAELTEEKQRLEHLVLQLQGETETIGEYITLYQQQRRLLKQKDMERDLQLQQLANDREMMKLKLKELNYLVHRLVLEQDGGNESLRPPTPTNNGSDHMGYSPNDNCFVDNTSPGGTQTENGAMDATRTSQHTNGEDNSPLLPKVHIKRTETAGRILSLLTDIKEANIPYGSGVQHCSCCSGRLETV